jgi:choline dehydrogenase-like flavoprotein
MQVTDIGRYVRGSDTDYDDWAEMAGDKSWAWSGMKNYMRKHQTLEPVDSVVTDRSSLHFVEANHGTSGPVRTSFNDIEASPLDVAFLRGLEEAAGVSKKPVDPWSGDHIGFFSTLGSVARTGPNKGKRSYAARGYYEPNAHRSNLTVLCGAYVNQVILDGDQAIGVKFSHSGSDHEVKTKREVLVCQGTIMSPQLLELSGIGNPDILKKAGVEPKIILPSVGENFQEHPGSFVLAQLTPGNMTMDSLQDPQIMALAQKALTENKGGPLTAVSAIQGFWPYKRLVSSEELQKTVQSIKDTPARSKFHRKQLDQVIANLESDTSANLQFVFLPVRVNKENWFEDHSRAFIPPPPGEPLEVGLLAVVSYPVSRGSIHISSSGELFETPKHFRPELTAK